MRNDRGRRGGKAGAKSGRGEGRGRGSISQGDAQGGKGNPGDSGGKTGGTGGARGRGQPRQGGRGGRGGGAKRAVASVDTAAGVAGSGGPPSLLSKAQRRAGSRASKKAKTGEGSKVLWSPSKSKGPERGGFSSRGSTGDAQDVSVLADLSVMARTFKERYGEEVASDEEDTDLSESSDVFESSVRRRGSSSAISTPLVEEAAMSMSPAKLAAEVQKARARAREERFGGGGGGAIKPPRSLPNGKAAAGPRGTPASRTPLHRSSRGQSNNRTNLAHPSFLPQETCGGNGSGVAASAPEAPTPAETMSTGVTSASTTPALTSAATGSGGAAVDANPTAFPPPTTTSGPASRATAGTTSIVPPCDTSAALRVGRPDTEDVDTNASSKPGRVAAATATAAEAISVDDTPTTTSATAAAGPKRPAPGGGNVVVVEPPAKRVSTPSPRQAGTAGGKIHTLRLRLRTDVGTKATQPESIQPPAGEASQLDGAGSGGGGGSGVEECKGFAPPNPRPDAGVEECKGFDPPNLPPTPKRPPDAAPNVATPQPTVSETTPATPARAAGEGGGRGGEGTAALASASTAAASPSGVTANGLTPTYSASAREASWGPSFGIVGAAAAALMGARDVPPTPAPSPDVARSKTPNPWILSPDAPTFARNQGRPLAGSFPKPVPSAAKSSGSPASNGLDGPAERVASARGGAEVLRPVVTRAGGGRGGMGWGVMGVRGRLGEQCDVGTPRAPDGSSTPRVLPSPSARHPVGGVMGSKAADTVLQAQALLPGSTTSGASNARPPPPVGHQEPSTAGVAPPPAVAAAGAALAAAGFVAGAAEVPMAAGATGASDAVGGQVMLGVQMSTKVEQLLAKMRQEREESLVFERKLTQALLD